MTLKVSTSTFSTAGVTKAGKLGPMRMFLTPRCSKASRMQHRLLLVPREHEAQGKFIDTAFERLGQRQRHLDRRERVVALAHVEQARQAGNGAVVLAEQTELAAAERQDHPVPRHGLPQIRRSRSAPFGAVAAADQHELVHRAALDRIDHRIGDAENGAWPKPTR